MTIRGKAYIVGAYEHPLRKAPNHSAAQLHAEVAKGAIEDAGLTRDDIDGFFAQATRLVQTTSHSRTI
jgi:acetyl-CoA C-acetyltransferase